MPYVYIPDAPPPSRFAEEYNPYAYLDRSQRSRVDPLDFVKALDRYSDAKEAKKLRLDAEKKKKDDDKKKDGDKKKIDWKSLQPFLFWSLMPVGYIFFTGCMALSHALQEMVK